MSTNRTIACRILAIVAAAGAVVASAHAQVRAGVDAGGSIGVVSGAIPVYAGSSECGQFEIGGVDGIGGGLRLHLPELFGALGGIVRLGYATSATSFTAAPIDPLVVYDAESDSTIDVPREYALTMRDARVEATLMLAMPVSGGLSVAVGARVGIRTSSGSEQVERITGGEQTFATGSTERPLVAPTTIAPATLVAGFSAAASLRIELGSGFALEPTVGVELDPFGTIGGAAWRDVRASLALPLTFELGGDEERSRIVEPPTDTPTTAATSITERPAIASPVTPNRIDARMEIVALDEAGNTIDAARVTVYETSRRVRIPLDATIEFAENSATLAEAYRAPDGEAPDRFDPDSLAIADAGALMRRSLDVVARRMREQPSSRVVLMPSTTQDEPSWLGFARAEAVRTYFEDVWDIPRARIEIRPAVRGRGARATRRVEIGGEPRSLVAPFETERPERIVEPPLVSLDPTYSAEAGVADASIVLTHEGRTIGRYREGAAEETDVNWPVDLDRVGRPTTLGAELHVRDSLGGERTATDSLPVRVERHIRTITRTIAPDHASERIVATLFDEGPTSRRNRAAVAELAAMVRPGARVTVDGSDAVRDELAVRLRNVQGVVVRSRRGDAVRIAVEQPLR